MALRTMVTSRQNDSCPMCYGEFTSVEERWSHAAAKDDRSARSDGTPSHDGCHESCLNGWMNHQLEQTSQRPTCPFCRERITNDSIEAKMESPLGRKLARYSRAAYYTLGLLTTLIGGGIAAAATGRVAEWGAAAMGAAVGSMGVGAALQGFFVKYLKDRGYRITMGKMAFIRNSLIVGAMGATLAASATKMVGITPVTAAIATPIALPPLGPILGLIFVGVTIRIMIRIRIIQLQWEERRLAALEQNAD